MSTADVVIKGAGRAHAALTAGTERGADALLVVGLITAVAAGGLIAATVAVSWAVHRGKGFTVAGEGWGVCG